MSSIHIKTEETKFSQFRNMLRIRSHLSSVKLNIKFEPNKAKSADFCVENISFSIGKGNSCSEVLKRICLKISEHSEHYCKMQTVQKKS